MLHDGRCVSRPAWLVAQIVGPHDRFLQSGLRAGPFAEIVLQLVELRDQAVGVGQRFEIAALLYQQHAREVSAGYQLHRCGGHPGQHLLECPRRGDLPRQFGHAHRQLTSGT